MSVPREHNEPLRRQRGFIDIPPTEGPPVGPYLTHFALCCNP